MTDLVHLLQFQTDLREAAHELLQSFLSQILIELFGLIALCSDIVKLFRSFHELPFSCLILLEDFEVRSCALNRF